MDDHQYEDALFQLLSRQFRAPHFSVRRKDSAKVRGKLSRAIRKPDTAVFERSPQGERIVLLADAKYRSRPLHVKHAESFLGFMEDVDAGLGLLVSPLKSSKGARNRVQGRVDFKILPPDEALQLNWLEEAGRIFPWDPIFHPEIAGALAALEQNQVDRLLEFIEPLPFEETKALFARAPRRFSPVMREALLQMARNRSEDSGRRFHAIIELRERYGGAPDDLVEAVVQDEPDVEARALLRGEEI